MNFPHIWKSGQRPGIYIDLATYLLENRTIFIGPEITSEVASLVAMQILALSQEKGPISLYLNCNGGSVPAGLAIVDLVRYVDRTEETPVNTYCIGECIGVACAILISGRKGERRAFPSARISLYQEWYGAESLWGARSQDSHERDRLIELLQDIFVRHTNPDQLKPDRLKSYFSELAFLSSEEAIQFGIIDELC